MGEIEVHWERQRLRGGTPLERWQAHVIKPFVSRDFAWVLRKDGYWQVYIMLRDVKIRRRAVYACKRPDMPMRHTERWITSADRWKRLLVASGEDPRGKFDRFAPTSDRYCGAVQAWEFFLHRGHT